MIAVSQQEMAYIIDVVFFVAVCLTLMRIKNIRDDLRDIKNILQNQAPQNYETKEEPPKIHSWKWVAQTLFWTISILLIIVGIVVILKRYKIIPD